MPESREAVKEALAIEEESASGIEAALGEQQQGEPALSAGLLLDAIQKERESLDLMEQGVETFRQALEDRRRALETQEEIVQNLVESFSNQQRQSDETKRSES